MSSRSNLPIVQDLLAGYRASFERFSTLRVVWAREATGTDESLKSQMQQIEDRKSAARNPAATLWCTAAIGTIAGAGFALHALIGALTILILNIGLRPVANDRAMQDVMSRLNIEPSVTSVSWERV